MQKIGSLLGDCLTAGTHYVVALDSAPADAGACFLVRAGAPMMPGMGDFAAGAMWPPMLPAGVSLASVGQPHKLPVASSFDPAQGMPFEGADNTAGAWFAIVKAEAPGVLAAHVIG